MAIKGDVLDLTDLKKRGLLKVAEKTAEEGRVNSQGYVELGSGTQSFSSGDSEHTSSSDSGVSALGFLDSLASSGAGNVSSGFIGSSSGADSLELQGLKNKIDDLEYKLDRLMEKVARMESVN